MKKLITNAVIAFAIVLFGHHLARFIIEHRIASGVVAFGAMTLAPVVKAAFNNSAAELKVPFTGALKGLLTLVAVASNKAVSKMSGSEQSEETVASPEQISAKKVGPVEEKSAPVQEKPQSLQDQLIAMKEEVLGEMEQSYVCMGDDEDEFSD